MTHPLSKHKGPYRAGVTETWKDWVFDDGGNTIFECHDPECAQALADRLNRAEEMEKVISLARIYAQARQAFPTTAFESRIEDAGFALAEAVRALPPTPESET